jgi:hypothetical protein
MKLTLLSALFGCASLLAASSATAKTAPAGIAQTNVYVNEIYVTDFRIEGSTQPLSVTPSRDVKYTVRLSKPHTYHGLGTATTFDETLSGNIGAATRSISNNFATFNSGGYVPGWVDDGNGRDHYDVTDTEPTLPRGVTTAGFNTSKLANTKYTHIYAVVRNQNATDYADPGALRGASAGFLIDKGPVCISNNGVFNVTFSAGQAKTFSAGDIISAGGVVVNSGASLTLKARNKVLLTEGVAIKAGAEAQFYIDNSVCTSSAKIADDSGETATSDRASDVSRSLANSSEEQQSATLAYPNPVSEALVLPENISKVTLLDIQGIPVRAAVESGKINVQGLTEGLYNLQMRQNGKVLNQHIQVKH